MKPYIIDILVLIIILWELLMGLRRGLSGELFRLFGTCVVVMLGFGFYDKFGQLIAAHSRLAQNQEMAFALAFLLIVAGISLCFFLLRIILHLLVSVKFNDAFDRPAGALAGIMRGFLIAVVLVFAVGLWPNETLQSMIKADSYVGRTVFKYAPQVTEKIHSLQIRFQPVDAQSTQESDEKTNPKSEPR